MHPAVKREFRWRSFPVPRLFLQNLSHAPVESCRSSLLTQAELRCLSVFGQDLVEQSRESSGNVS
jgi:hypothetical protein